MNSIMSMQHRLSNKQGLPLRLLAAIFVISILATVASGWLSWQMHERAEEMSRKHIELTEGIGRIRLLDEVLTLLARMAAATGDFSYEKRYDLFDPQLTTEINKTRALLPQAGAARFVTETDEANRALVKMERQAFALAHQGRRQGATALLNGAEFMKFKQVYASGMEKTADAVNDLIETENRYFHTLALVLVAASAIGVLTLMLAWFFAIRSARRWDAQHRTAEKALRKARDELESRVEQRTADLLDANKQLQREVSERQQAQDQLRESEEKFSKVFESNPAMIAIGTPDGRMVDVNLAYANFLGYSRKEILGKSLADLGVISSAELQRLLKLCQGAGDSLRNVEVTLQGRGSRLLTALLSADIVTLGGASYRLATLQDITSRKLAEEEIEFKNTILLTQQEVSPDAILVVDENARIISYNQHFIDLWHLSPELVHARLDARLLQAVAEKVENPQAFVARIQYLYEHRDEKSSEELQLNDGRIIDRYSAPLNGANGKYYGRVWYFRNITERKGVEVALKNMLAKFHSLFEMSSDAIMLLDDKGFFDCNEATLRLFGCSARDDFISKHPAEFSPPTQPAGEDSMRLANEHIATTLKYGNELFEWIYRRQDGTEFPAEVLLTALELGGKPVLQATVRDISERKQVEARLAEQLDELRRWHEVTVGREGRILDLKHEVNEMLGQAGHPPRYPSAEAQQQMKD